MATVKDMVKEWLEQHGYTGLVGDCCGCGIDDLMPCDNESVIGCEPGYKKPCKPEDCENCQVDCYEGKWHEGAEVYVAEKPEPQP